jgi:hypothetical protein
MESGSREKIVDFDKYCPTCQSKAISSIDEPCNECLNNPTNLDSRKPVKYKEAKK